MTWRAFSSWPCTAAVLLDIHNIHHYCDFFSAIRDAIAGRGLHWSTFQLNVSAFCGIWGHLGFVSGVIKRS